MQTNYRPVRITSLIIISTGLILLALNIFLDNSLNIALPLLFLVLGGGFFILVFIISPKWNWGLFLYIPGALFIIFGLIFLLNVLTSDWNSWAYSWLLLIMASGMGLLLANRTNKFHPVLNQIGWGMTISGIAFFVIFGAIAGGLFIKVMAPILLVITGFSIRWLHIENLLPDTMLKRLNFQYQQRENVIISNQTENLIEQLSIRELEVLKLIYSGLTNQQIAEQLSVAPSTVKTHINNIYGKLGVKTRVQAVNRARELGLEN